MARPEADVPRPGDLRLQSANLLHGVFQAAAAALQQELPREQRAIELALGQDRLGRRSLRYSRPASCQDLPSVAMAGAITISTRCISSIVGAPSAVIDWRTAPTRFWVPCVVAAGPNRICSSGSCSPMRIPVPRGSARDGAAMPQLKPRPGASMAAANGEPSMTASAPEAMALAMSPPVFMPPSVMTGTYRPVSAW